MIEYVKLFIGLTAKVIMGIAFFCIVAIVAPASFLTTVGLLTLRESNLHWIWLTLAASICLLLPRALFALFPVFKGRLNGMVVAHRGKKRLRHLTQQEKRILRGYDNTWSQSFDCTDGVILALEYEHIVYQASNISMEFTTFSYNIQPWARYYLRKHPELLR